MSNVTLGQVANFLILSLKTSTCTWQMMQSKVYLTNMENMRKGTKCLKWFSQNVLIHFQVKKLKNGMKLKLKCRKDAKTFLDHQAKS